MIWLAFPWDHVNEMPLDYVNEHFLQSGCKKCARSALCGQKQFAALQTCNILRLQLQNMFLLFGTVLLLDPVHFQVF